MPKFNRRIYRVRCQSGLSGWRTRLRNNYQSLEDFTGYDGHYALATRLGYASAASAWRANPVIEGSVNPSDFRKVRP